MTVPWIYYILHGMPPSSNYSGVTTCALYGKPQTRSRILRPEGQKRGCMYKMPPIFLSWIKYFSIQITSPICHRNSTLVNYYPFGEQVKQLSKPVLGENKHA